MPCSFEAVMMFQCFPIVKPTGLGPLPLKPGTWHLRCPWTNRCGSEEGCRGWFQPAQPASHHPATRHGGANGRCQGNKGHPCKDGRTFTWRLTLEDLRYWATTSPGKESAVLWFRHETVGIHFLPGLGIVQVTNKRDFMHFSVETTTVGSTAELSISLLHAIRRCNQEMHIMLTRHNCRQHSTTL